jgi:hypothetical protein
MPDPLAMHRERKMHSKTYTKSPRVWKVCCRCFLPVLRRQRRAVAVVAAVAAAAPAFSSLLAFITCSALTS